MELSAMIRSCVIINDPEFQESLTLFRKRHNINVEPYPVEVSRDLDAEAKIFSRCLLKVIKDKNYKNNIYLKELKPGFFRLEDVFEYREIFIYLWEYARDFCEEIFRISDIWFPESPPTIIGNYDDPVQRFLLRCIFFKTDELPEIHFKKIYLHSFNDISGVYYLIKLIYAEKLIEHIYNFDLDTHMEKNDPHLHGFLEGFRRSDGKATTKHKSFLELYPGITRKDIKDNWDEIQKGVQRYPLRWKKYVKYFNECQFNNKLIEQVCDEHNEELDPSTVYKGIKRIAEIAGYELRARPPRRKSKPKNRK